MIDKDFESWARAAGFNYFCSDGHGCYEDSDLGHAYLGWCANKNKSSIWISVEDRLPKHDGDYLASDGKNVDLCSFYNRHKAFCPQTHDPEYFKKATHWMELPEPQK